MSVPSDHARNFTDEQLRHDLAAGLKPADIARKYEVTRSAVSQRVKRLDLTTTSAAVAPTESRRHVAQAFDVMQQLSRNVVRANLLQDACDEWLREVDAEGNPTGRYDIGARAGEVEVTYKVEVRTASGYQTQKRKKSLAELLSCINDGHDEDGARFCGVEKGEYRHADPRELILKTQQETRQTAALVIEALQKLTDARMLQDWRQAMVEEVGKESPDCARRIAERIERSIVLHAAFAGPGGLLGSN